MSLEWVLLGLRILATVILYIFLGFAFYLIWRDLKYTDQRRVDLNPSVTYYLRVIATGDDQSLAIGDALPLFQPVTLLGRAPESTIVLHDASISARHVCLTRQDGVWWLEDLGSQNGTLLNDLLLSKPMALTPGDIIGIGELRLKLETRP